MALIVSFRDDRVSVDRAGGPYCVLLSHGSIWNGVHISLTRSGVAGTSGLLDLLRHESGVWFLAFLAL